MVLYKFCIYLNSTHTVKYKRIAEIKDGTEIFFKLKIAEKGKRIWVTLYERRMKFQITFLLLTKDDHVSLVDINNFEFCAYNFTL